MTETQAFEVLAPEEVAARQLHIGNDNRVYRTTKGNVQAIVPTTPQGYSSGKLLEYRTDKVPPLGQLRTLFDAFMKHYNQEVFVLYGQDRTDPNTWHFMVPEQEGTAGGVEHDDQTAILELTEKAKIIGSVHTHPGNSAQPSTIDLDDWAKPERYGIHFILARDGSYTLNACVGGKTFIVQDGKLPVLGDEVNLWTSGGRPIEELLKEPKQQHYTVHDKRSTSTTTQPWGFERNWDYDYRSDHYEWRNDEMEETPEINAADQIAIDEMVREMEQFGAITIAPSDTKDDLAYVIKLYDGSVIILSAEQYDLLWHNIDYSVVETETTLVMEGGRVYVSTPDFDPK